MKVWGCKIGEVPDELLALDADGPMCRAVEEAYIKITGQAPEFIFSGWGVELTESERFAVIEEYIKHDNQPQQGEGES